MSQSDLNALERDVEKARARFAKDLARLRSPVNLARFKDDLWAEARETKDEWVEKTKEAAKDGSPGGLAMTKEPKKLDDLFHDTLKDIYFAEKKILTALPKMAKA